MFKRITFFLILILSCRPVFSQENLSENHWNISSVPAFLLMRGFHLGVDYGLTNRLTIGVDTANFQSFNKDTQKQGRMTLIQSDLTWYMIHDRYRDGMYLEFGPQFSLMKNGSELNFMGVDFKDKGLAGKIFFGYRIFYTRGLNLDFGLGINFNDQDAALGIRIEIGHVL